MGAVAPALIAGGISTGIGLASSRSQARAIKTQGKYEAATAAQSARFAELQAEDAIERGRREAGRLKMGARQLLGRQRASLAAQGVELESGTPLAVQEDTAALSALDALQITNNAYRESLGFRSQAQDFFARSRFARLGSRAQARSTLLTGALGAAREAFAFGSAASRYGGGALSGPVSEQAFQTRGAAALEGQLAGGSVFGGRIR